MPASQAPQPSATPSPTRTRRSQPWPTSKLKIRTTANIALFAIAAHADEAHSRKVERSGHSLPEGSYGRRNRQAIATRETRVAARLRAVEHAYRTAIEHDTASRPLEPTRTFRSPERQADREMELE